ncbi:MAG: hypothetical protein A3F70_00010 [Acidobacteria bacterium RIFCSPLOWO2_12_FULL_67_14]|nr:MAG: hypothetical protein A3F70_00010 [Acidobacteria bacterium RIFCSPLOWO2_12_FULL_67_14]
MAPPDPLALAPEIDLFRQELERISAEADVLVSPLGEIEFAWKPAPQSWSVAECLDHLNAAARVYLPVVDEGIADAIRRGLYGPGPYHYNAIGRLHVYLAQPPARIRARAAARLQPPAGRPRHEIMAAFRAYQVQYIDRLRQANGLDLARARVTSPAIAWLPIPLGSAFALTIAHEHRHLAQARRVIEKMGLDRPVAS